MGILTKTTEYEILHISPEDFMTNYKIIFRKMFSLISSNKDLSFRINLSSLNYDLGFYFK